MDAQAQRAEFWTDLASAARALVNQPSVPLVSLLAWWLPSITVLSASGLHSVTLRLTVIIAQQVSLFFLLGWYGAERVFFQRHLAGKPVTLRHLLGLVKPFMGRFVVLGLPFGITFTVFFGVLFTMAFAAAIKEHPPQHIHMPAWFPVVFGVLFIALDFALTFVTPALAYTTRSAFRAMGIGFGMIRQTWPRCTLYVLCPPLALNILLILHPVSHPAVQLALSTALAIVGLLAKGAIAAFYLRERGSYGDDGAAYITEGDEPPGSVPLTTPIDHRRSR